MLELHKAIFEIIIRLFTQRKHVRQIFIYALGESACPPHLSTLLDPDQYDWNDPQDYLIQEIVELLMWENVNQRDSRTGTRLLRAIKTYANVKYKRGLLTQDEMRDIQASLTALTEKFNVVLESLLRDIDSLDEGVLVEAPLEETPLPESLTDANRGEQLPDILSGIDEAFEAEIDEIVIPAPPKPIEDFPAPLEVVNEEIPDWLKESPDDAFGIEARVEDIRPVPIDGFPAPTEDVKIDEAFAGEEADPPPVSPIPRPGRPITQISDIEIDEDMPDWLKADSDDALAGNIETPDIDVDEDVPDWLKATLDDESENAPGEIVPPPPVPIPRPTRPISPAPPAPFPGARRDEAPRDLISADDLDDEFDDGFDDEFDDEFEGADFESQGSRGRFGNLFGAGKATPPTAKPVLFSAYFPPKAPVNQRAGLYVYAHTEITKALIEMDVAKYVQELGGTIPKPREANQTATLELGTRIKVVPECEELQLEPQSVTKTWRGDWTRFEFDILPTANLAGQFIFIRVSIRIEEIEIANIKCPIEIVDGAVAADPIDTVPVADTAGRETSLAGFIRKADLASNLNPLLAAKFKVASTNAYRNIFISYSRRDSQVVRAFKTVQIAMGHEVFLDVDNLRTGENWRAALARAIDRADTFQLFWSQNSAESEYCRYEWDYALAKSARSNHTDGFIRPVYWRKPMPSPPAELSDLNFKFCEFEKQNRVVAAVRGVMGWMGNLVRRLTGRPQVSGSHET